MLLHLENIHKRFGAVKALRGVSLEVQAAEVHGLIGENGAGKSTLMKILSGALSADEGTMFLDGNPFRPADPLAGRNAGIAMIYQELNLAPHLTVEENLTLGIEKSRLGWIHTQSTDVAEVLETLGQSHIKPSTIVKTLSIGKQQLVEIGRALIQKARIVVMDEPTSSLSASDTKVLFGVIRKLKDAGVSVIYISHFLEEVREVCDRFTVIRDGETVSSGKVADTTMDLLVTDMVGRSVDELYPTSDRSPGDPLLSVSNISGVSGTPESASFSVRKGEILGIAGLVGAGRSETIRTIFGLESASDGTVSIRDHPEIRVSVISPRRALDLGMDLLSENRKVEGLALNLSVRANITLSALKRYRSGVFLKLRQENEGSTTWIDRIGIRLADPGQPVNALSGGNQQKTCLARLLHQDSDILFLDEPTRGIDIGSKADIYRLVQELADRGKAIVLVSSYLPELFGMCDSLAVMYRGKLSSVRPLSDWTETSVMHYATSGAE